MKIVDPLLEPYSITVDGDNYVLGIEKEYTKPSGEKYTVVQNTKYFFEFSLLVKKLIKIKAEDTKETVSLEEFLVRYKQIMETIDNKLKVLKSS